MESAEKIKKLQEQLEAEMRSRVELKESYDKLHKDYINARSELTEAKRINERFLNIIENLAESVNKE